MRLATLFLVPFLALFSCGGDKPAEQDPGKSSGGGSDPQQSSSTAGDENFEYFEKEMHGRVHVSGTKEGRERLEKGEGVPYERTIIGGAAGNKTLKIEIDKDNEAMTDRLLVEYKKRHDMN